MKNINLKKILLLVVFAYFVNAKINGQELEYKILFIQPSATKVKEYKNWMVTEENKLDISKCCVIYNDQELEDLNEPYRKKRKTELEQYVFWMYKTVTKNNDLITIKYELEDRRVNPKVKKVLGVFKGFQQTDFEEWFSKSIFKYCNKLLKSGNLNLTTVYIGQMSDNPVDISNIPISLNMNLLDYKFKEASFTDRYAVQLDDKLSSSGLICINMVDMKSMHGGSYSKINLMVVVNNVSYSKGLIVDLKDNFNTSLKTASTTIAEIIAKYSKK